MASQTMYPVDLSYAQALDPLDELNTEANVGERRRASCRAKPVR